MAIAEGQPAPAFSLPSTEGKPFSLKDCKGKIVVLYFYPRDATPGCTAEACSFRDSMDSYIQKEAVVLGVSPDDENSHTKFKTRFGLPFTLLSDADHAVAKAYGVWQEKSMYGKKYMGIVRSTFIIDKKGKIARIFSKVKVDGHSKAVLAAIGELEK